MENLLSKGVWAVSHFMNHLGEMIHEVLPCQGFCLKFSLRYDPKIYYKLIKAMPVNLKSMVS